MNMNDEYYKNQLTSSYVNFMNETNKWFDEKIAEDKHFTLDEMFSVVSILKDNNRKTYEIVKKELESIGFKVRFDALSQNVYTKFIQDFVSKLVDNTLDLEKIPEITIKYSHGKMDRLKASWQVNQIKNSLVRYILNIANNFNMDIFQIKPGQTEYDGWYSTVITFKPYAKMISDYYKNFTKGN